MKKYEVDINGITHHLLLDEEDVDRYPGAKLYKAPKAAPVTAPAAPVVPDVPADGASLEEWSKYAVEVKGAKPEDLTDKGKALDVVALKAKYGTTQS